MANNIALLADKCIDDRAVNGHSILLLEVKLGQRTFRDYPDVSTTFERLLSMFESEKQLLAGSYDLSMVFDWLDEFANIQLFTFDKEMLRYVEHNRDKLKEKLFSFAQQANEEEQ